MPTKPTDISPSLKGIRYVIFPSSRFAQYWDLLMIFVVIYYAVYIPFHLGISGGYLAETNNAWLAFNMLTNFIFIVDTFLVFFRAYRDKNGRLVYSLSRIRKNYIRSGWFLLNLLACFPGTFIVLILTRGMGDEELDTLFQNTQVKGSVLFAFEMFKLFRLARIKRLVTRSHIISRFWEIFNVETTLVFKFLFLITLFSHWIACLWGLIAFIEAQSFGNELTTTMNWIGHWYESSYVEGGLNPIGQENYMQRYWLCLFWSIQSITSIGYGNIVPVTEAEFAYASFLMLACGVFWAYIIGALVEAVSSMGSLNKEYVTKMNDANQMVSDFTTDTLPLSKSGSLVEIGVSKRVRRFITEQRDRATTKTMESNSAEFLYDKYPSLSTLSPELRKVCVLHLAHTFIETVPYLSSKYMSPDEQVEIAVGSFQLEFSVGETFRVDSEYGRGILIFMHGIGIATRHVNSTEWKTRKGGAHCPVDVNEVLVEDDFYEEEQLVYHFPGFTKVFFIPRSVVIRALEKNERAWKECARWKYFSACFVLKSLHANKPTLDSV